MFSLMIRERHPDLGPSSPRRSPYRLGPISYPHIVLVPYRSPYRLGAISQTWRGAQSFDPTAQLNRCCVQSFVSTAVVF